MVDLTDLKTALGTIAAYEDTPDSTGSYLEAVTELCNAAPDLIARLEQAEAKVPLRSTLTYAALRVAEQQDVLYAKWNAERAAHAETKAEVERLRVCLHPAPLPCGHTAEHGHTSDGGKTILCCQCERERLLAEIDAFHRHDHDREGAADVWHSCYRDEVAAHAETRRAHAEYVNEQDIRITGLEAERDALRRIDYQNTTKHPTYVRYTR